MILRSLHSLKKTLIQIDPIYSSVNEYMTINDKMSYCKSLMAETQFFLHASANLMNEKTKEKYNAIIYATKKEIERLSDSDTDPGSDTSYLKQ
ncbi:MAG: hypothetical protein K0S33_3929 [Bacteroidetes bacterium]|nr:hypothetical protein [Bacteroidota bacterium]